VLGLTVGWSSSGKGEGEMGYWPNKANLPQAVICSTGMPRLQVADLKEEIGLIPSQTLMCDAESPNLRLLFTTVTHAWGIFALQFVASI
jgi:hypothetical protein